VRNNCVVPSGKFLFLPILNLECSNIEGNGATAMDLRSCAAPISESAVNLELDIDGSTVPSPQRFRALSPSFHFDLPDGNLLGAPAGSCFPDGALCQPYQSISDGYYVMLAPLANGRHTIHFHGTFPTFPFTLDVTYHLKVGA
jgi:hypothetical protein